MGIRISGTNRVLTGEKILEYAIGTLDPYGEPFELITLIWTPRKKMFHRGKSKGFEDCVIRRNPESRQIIIKYRSGSAEWLKDPVGGAFVARIPRTEHNLSVLASNYYDNLWTIKDSHIRSLVKEMADAIDEACKKIPCPYLVGGTWYDFNKAKRENHFKDSRKMNISLRGAEKVAENQMVLEEAKLERRRMEIERKEALLKEREEALLKKSVSVPTVKKDVLPEPSIYTGEDLKKMNTMTLKKKAKDEFGIMNSFSIKKEDLIPMVLEKQKLPLIAEVSHEPETEIVIN